MKLFHIGRIYFKWALWLSNDELDALRELADTREVAYPKSHEAEQFAGELSTRIDEALG